MKKTEIIAAIIAIIGFIFKLFLWPGGGPLIVISLSTLAVVYYFGFAFLNNIRFRHIFKKESYNGMRPLRIIGTLGAGFSLSAVLMGIMYKIQSWPMAQTNLAVGMFFLIVVVIVGLPKYLSTKSDYLKQVFKRAVIIGGLGLIFIVLPQTVWIDIEYRNHPAYRDAFKRALAEPSNQALWDQVEQEKRKMLEEEFPK